MEDESGLTSRLCSLTLIYYNTHTKVGVTLVFRQRTTTVIVSVVCFVYILLYIDQAVLSVRGKFYYCTYNISTSASTRADRSAGFRNASKVTRIS